MMLCGWGVKTDMVCEWLAGKTAWFPSWHGLYLNTIEMCFFPMSCYTNRPYFTSTLWLWLLIGLSVCLSVCADICRSGCTADNIRRGINIHLYSAGQVVSQCLVGHLSLCSWSLAPGQCCVSLLQGGIHRPRPRASRMCRFVHFSCASHGHVLVPLQKLLFFSFSNLFSLILNFFRMLFLWLSVPKWKLWFTAHTISWVIDWLIHWLCANKRGEWLIEYAIFHNGLAQPRRSPTNEIWHKDSLAVRMIPELWIHA